MKDKLRRLDPLLRRAEQRTQQAAREYAAKTRTLANQEAQLGDLLRYSDEYARWPNGGSLRPAQIANREAFRERIDVAIDQQRRVVENSRVSAEVERTRLVMARRDGKVIENLAANYRAELVKTELDREQKALDEHASNGFRQRPRAES